MVMLVLFDKEVLTLISIAILTLDFAGLWIKFPLPVIQVTSVLFNNKSFIFRCNVIAVS